MSEIHDGQPVRAPARDDVRIHRASAEQLPELLTLFRAYQAHYGQLTVADEKQTRRFLARHLGSAERGFALVAVEASRLVGFAVVYFTASGLIAEDLAHLGDLYVAPDARRRGIASALVAAVKDECVACGIGRVRWLSLTTNDELNRWYATLGDKSGEFCLFLSRTDGPVRPTGDAP